MKTNPLPLIFLRIILLSILLSMAPTLTFATGKGSDGGADKRIFDLTLEKVLGDQSKALLESALKRRILNDAEEFTLMIRSGQLKQEILKFVRDTEFIDSIADRPSKNLLKFMLDNGLVDDIENTPYQIREHCYDEGRVEKVLSTTIGLRRSPICVSPIKFFKDYYQGKPLFKIKGNPGEQKVENDRSYTKNPFWQIIALFLHDHARQFGEIVNDDHSFSAAMAIAVYSYPMLFDFNETDFIIRGNDERDRKFLTFVYISGLWKPSDLVVTVSIPKDSPCAQIPEKYRKVLNSGSSSLVQTFSLEQYSHISLFCESSELFSAGYVAVPKAEVQIKTKSGRKLISFTAKSGHSYDWRYNSIYLLPLNYKINGEALNQ